MGLETVREERLDALRGIAALCVAAGHCVTARSIEPQYNKTFQNLNYDSLTAVALRLMHIIFNAEAAVIIFFVLSGYVLTKSLSKIYTGYMSEFFSYVVKRVYRILPTVVVSFIPLAYFMDRSAWEYVRNMLLIKVSINGVTWTLQIEMLASLLIFGIFIISKKAKMLAIPIFIVLVVLFFTDYQPIYFKYFPAFFLGCYVNEIRKYMKGQKYLVPLAIFFLISADFYFGYSADATIITETICSVILIAFTSTSSVLKFLDHGLFKYLGKISFSFYLYHLLGAYISLKICEKLGISLGSMHQVTSVLLYIAMSVPIAIIVSSISYYLVEKPSMIVGSTLAKVVKEKLQLVKMSKLLDRKIEPIK